MSEKSLEEQIKAQSQKSRKLARYMCSTADLVENQIQKAFERGDFDNLEGSGKPLKFDENPYENQDLRMIFKILKDNDCAPFWIELGKEIDADFEKHQQEIKSFHTYASIFYSEKRNKQARDRFEKKKASFLFEERRRLELIRKKIIDYNLMCPTFQVGRNDIRVEECMFQVIADLEAHIEKARKKRF